MGSQSPYKPPFAVIDFETEAGGRASAEWWRPDFRVISCAFSWPAEDGSIRSEYAEGENAVELLLRRLAKASIPLVAHNIQFEWAVTSIRFPEVAAAITWYADTMRLAQVYDNGGDKFAMEAPLSLDDLLDATDGGEDAEPALESTAGLGLVKCVRRILKRPDHKKEAHRWLRENVAECKKGKEGSYLNRLPKDILQRYNVGDTEACLELFVFLRDFFKSTGYDWTLDHRLYFASVERIIEAQRAGVRVNREALEAYRKEIVREIRDIECQFRWRFDEQIRKVERSRLLVQVQKRKTLRGRKRFVASVRRDPCKAVDAVVFNVGSNKQLEALFCGVLGLRAKFITAKGSPSFRSAVLSQWGDGGEMLKRRRKRLLVLKQAESLLALSARDGRWHLSLKACGTATGRFAGGSNV